MRHDRYINPIEISFYQWLNSNPNSYHALDLIRFYDFILTVHHYKKEGLKWRNKDFFKKKCDNKIEDIDNYFQIMYTILDFLEVPCAPLKKKKLYQHSNDHDDEYYINYQEGNHLIIKSTSKDLFNSTNSLKRARSLKNNK